MVLIRKTKRLARGSVDDTGFAESQMNNLYFAGDKDVTRKHTR